MFSARVALGFLVVSGTAVAQQYVISTVAGGPPLLGPVAATSLSIGRPGAITVDGSGNAYFTSVNHCVFRLDPTGMLTRIAGNSGVGSGAYPADGVQAANAQITPGGVAVDGSGNVYIGGFVMVWEVAPTGALTRIAGDAAGYWGFSGDNGPARNALLFGSGGIALDSGGNLLIADSGNNRVRKVLTSGTITTIAGNGTAGYSGDGGQASNAQLNAPSAIAVDRSGNIYITDLANQRIRMVSTNGVISTVAGNGTAGYSGDGGPAVNAALDGPSSLAVDTSGNFYIADAGNSRIRKVSATGLISTVAGNGTSGYSGDGGQAVSASLGYAGGVAVDTAGNLYIADYVNYRIRKVSLTGTITSIAGNGADSYSGDGGSALSAQLSQPYGMAVDTAGNSYIADNGNNRIRKVATNGTITTIVGTGSRGSSGDGGPAIGAQLSSPVGVAVDGSNNLYIADYGNSRIRKVSPNGTISTVAGTGTAGFSGDGGLAISAQLYAPVGLCLDGAGNLYIADTMNNRIRKVSVNGTMSTVAGNGIRGYAGDGGPAPNAQLGNPQGVVVDSSGVLFIADTLSNRVRRVSPTGVITTIAGNGSSSDSGDGGPAANARLNFPISVGVDNNGSIYLADTGDDVVRRITPDGIINTVAGTGLLGYSGDGGPGNKAQLNTPSGVTVDATGRVFIVDQNNNAIRLLQVAPNSISVTNGASSLSGPISPGEIIVLYGSGLGPTSLVKATVGSNGLYPTQLAGTGVQVNGIPAPMIYTWATQVAAVVPYGINGSTAQVTVTYQGQTTTAFSVSVAASAPGVFSLDSTGTGQAAAINQDGFTLNTPASPAKVGDIISLYATGEGQTTPSGVDGKPAAVPFPQPNLPVSVTIGGQQTAKPQYAGGAPGEIAGVMQINVQIPTGIQTGNAVPVVLTVGNASSQPGLTIAVR